MEERLVSTVECILAGQSRQFGHHSYEPNAGHAADETVTFGHIANHPAYLLSLGHHVATENAGVSGRWLEKSEQRVEQRGLASAVGPEKSDAAPAQRGVQIVQNRSVPKAKAQSLELGPYFTRARSTD